MQMTYDEALDTLIDHTEIGYTIASQDKVWIVFTFDLDSTGKYAEFKYNRLYPLINTDTDEQVGWSYELMMLGNPTRPIGVPVWTSRAEAEFYAQELRHRLLNDNPEGPVADIHVMNLGDDARYEAKIIGRYGVTVRDTPKFTGSILAWRAMEEMSAKWLAEQPTSP